MAAVPEVRESRAMDGRDSRAGQFIHSARSEIQIFKQRAWTRDRAPGVAPLLLRRHSLLARRRFRPIHLQKRSCELSTGARLSFQSAFRSDFRWRADSTLRPPRHDTSTL